MIEPLGTGCDAPKCGLITSCFPAICTVISRASDWTALLG